MNNCDDSVLTVNVYNQLVFSKHLWLMSVDTEQECTLVGLVFWVFCIFWNALTFHVAVYSELVSTLVVLCMSFMRIMNQWLICINLLVIIFDLAEDLAVYTESSFVIFVSTAATTVRKAHRNCRKMHNCKNVRNLCTKECKTQFRTVKSVIFKP